MRLDTSKEGFETFLERPRSLTESYVVAHIHTLTLTKRCACDDILASAGAETRALPPRRRRARLSAAHAARRELSYDMRLFNRAVEIEENHNLHCRRARASGVRQVQSPGQAKCDLPSARPTTAHRCANTPGRRAPAGCLSALARSAAQWSRRPRICWRCVIDHAIGHRRVRVRDAQRAPRHTWRG